MPMWAKSPRGIRAELYQSQENLHSVRSGGVVSFDGQAGAQPQVGGRLTADLDNTAAFLADYFSFV